MQIQDGIVFVPEPMEEIRVKKVVPLEDSILLLVFENDETRLYDADSLLSLPAFMPLRNPDNFSTARILHGTVSWLSGTIDMAPETLYRDSYPYPGPV